MAARSPPADMSTTVLGNAKSRKPTATAARAQPRQMSVHARIAARAKNASLRSLSTATKRPASKGVWAVNQLCAPSLRTPATARG